MGKHTSIGKGSNVQPVAGCGTGPWAQGWLSKRFRGWRVPLTDGEHHQGNGIGTQQGLASATLILTHRFI